MGRLKGSKNRSNKTKVLLRFHHSIYRINVSYLVGYGTFEILGKDTLRGIGVSPGLDSLKSRVLNSILTRERVKGLRYYSVAWQTHQVTGEPHLDILLSYDKVVRHYSSSFNYLLELCPQRVSETTPGLFITPYSLTKLNKAILQYGSKEDPEVLSNFPSDMTEYLNLMELQKDPYLYLYKEMCKDPLKFDLEEYVKKNQLSQHISGWSSIKTKLKDMQVAAANLSLKDKPGFKPITQEVIKEKLNAEEFALFYGKWNGYRRIVCYLNQIVTLKGKRPMKTLNLLISGPPSIGKTSLFSNPNHSSEQHCVQDFCAVYPMGMSQWFPKYQSDVYGLILWNQAKLTSYSYDTILKLLQGSYMDLPNKGSVSRKVDNPLVIMTSNMTLQEMLDQKFGYNRTYLQMARRNLSVRVQNVVVPEGYNLFLLQKLLV